MTGSVFALIRTKYKTLSAAQKEVADYVLANAETVMTSSLNELATACNVSETTIIRFLRKLDYDSYQVLRVNIAQELSRGKQDEIYEEVQADDSAENVMKKVIQSTARSITDSAEVIDPRQIEEIAARLMKAKRILVIGMGASAAQAFDLHHKLLKLGLDAAYSHDPHIINIKCNNLTKDDALFVFLAYGGEPGGAGRRAHRALARMPRAGGDQLRALQPGGERDLHPVEFLSGNALPLGRHDLAHHPDDHHRHDIHHAGVAHGRKRAVQDKPLPRGGGQEQDVSTYAEQKGAVALFFVACGSGLHGREINV